MIVVGLASGQSFHLTCLLNLSCDRDQIESYPRAANVFDRSLGRGSLKEAIGAIVKIL